MRASFHKLSLPKSFSRRRKSLKKPRGNRKLPTLPREFQTSISERSIEAGGGGVLLSIVWEVIRMGRFVQAFGMDRSNQPMIIHSTREMVDALHFTLTG
jgi:hypothetical protein